MAARRKLLLVALIAVFAVILLAGSAARPVTVRSDPIIQTNCTCYWNGAKQMWCYRCCDVYGCYNLYCDWSGC